MLTYISITFQIDNNKYHKRGYYYYMYEIQAKLL